MHMPLFDLRTFLCALLSFLALGALTAAGQAASTRAPNVQSTITLPADGLSPELSGGSIRFIGNATLLIRYGGLTILTDPNFIHKHEQVLIGYGMEARRLTDPTTGIGELPPLDLIVLSHFHGDHFDQVAEQELAKALPIVTVPEAAEELEQRGFRNTRPVPTWSAVEVTKGDVDLRISAMPGRHGPPLSDLVLPEVMGSETEFESKGRPLQALHHRRHPGDRRAQNHRAALSAHRSGIPASRWH